MSTSPRPIRRTLADWRKVNTPLPTPEPKLTEAEYLALEARNQPPFYQLKAEFPGVTYDGHRYTIEGHQFERNFMDGIRIDGGASQKVISLSPVESGGGCSIMNGCPTVTDRESFARCITWLQTKQPTLKAEYAANTAWHRRRNRMGPGMQVFMEMTGLMGSPPRVNNYP